MKCVVDEQSDNNEGDILVRFLQVRSRRFNFTCIVFDESTNSMMLEITVSKISIQHSKRGGGSRADMFHKVIEEQNEEGGARGRV